MSLKTLLNQIMIVGLLFAGVHSPVFCEGANILNSSISISGYSSKPTSFKDSKDDSFKESHLGLTYFLPVGTGKYDSIGSGFYQSFTSLKYFSNNLEISTLDQSHRVHDTSIGGGILLLPGGNSTYLFAGGLNVKGEEFKNNSYSIGGGGFAGGLYINKDISWIYGGAFGYALGKGALFPVLGMHWKLSERSTFLTILPVLFQYTYEFTEDFKVSSFLGMKGNQYSLDLSEDSLNIDDPANVRIFQVKFGGRATYVFSENWAVDLELGNLTYRKFSIYDGSREVSSEELDPAGYVMLKATYRFRESIYEKILSETGWQ